MKKITLILFVWVFISISTFAQNVKIVSLPQFISSSLVVFGKYVEWPINHKNEDFVITVIGDMPVYKELNTMSQNVRIGAQKVTVRYVSKVSELAGFSHIIYLSEGYSGFFNKVVDKVGAENTLLVTYRNGLLSSGSGINFIEVDGRMKYEISKSNINKRNLLVHSFLEKMSAQ